MEELIYMLKLTQIELKQYLDSYLKDNNMQVVNDDGFLYAIGGYAYYVSSSHRYGI